MEFFNWIKGKLGFCQWKGCKHRGIYEIKMVGFGKKRSICEEHVEKITNGGTLKSVTYEQTVNLDR